MLPPKSYSGPLFTLSSNWPTAPLPPLVNAPWQKAINNGPITTANAAAYANALKMAVTPNARKLILDYANWNPGAAGWYNEPWVGSQREAIHGTYAAGEFDQSFFPGTGLQTQFNTNVLTYYDQRAASTLYRFWGKSAMTPNLTTQAAQFQEGAIVVKAAVFASENPKMQTGWWTAMNGAASWPLYIGVGPQSQSPPPPQLWSGYVAQFDIIVKDTQSSPQTGWVYMTLVYDASAAGKDAWDKMVPLGVQWGNDPQATSAGMPLKENWINPAAPVYSTQTLGWGGRLSGPNDGAVNDVGINGKLVRKVADSSCMSCHSTSEWNVAQHQMPAFLLPSFPTSSGPQTCGTNGKPDPNGNYICSPAPGSAAWMQWFQNRPGTTPFTAGSFATDFDEVFAFKTLELWWAATGPKNQTMPMLVKIPGISRRFNRYNGAPLPQSKR